MIVGAGGEGDWVFCEVRGDVGCYGVDGGLGCWDERFIRCGTREGRPVRRKQAWSLRSSVNLSPFGSADSQSRSLYRISFFVERSDIGNEIKRSLYGTRILGRGCLYAITYSLPAFCRDAICCSLSIQTPVSMTFKLFANQHQPAFSLPQKQQEAYTASCHELSRPLPQPQSPQPTPMAPN